jgi:hypothetical protein
MEKSTLTPATATASVTLRVTEFQPLPAPTGYALTLGAAPSHVTQTTHDQPNDQLHVKHGAVKLRFEITSGDSETYFPAGITFQHERTQAAAGCGASDSPFSAMKVDGTLLEVTDTVINAPATRDTYKFSVLIQRARDGALGIIDPFIENEN